MQKAEGFFNENYTRSKQWHGYSGARNSKKKWQTAQTNEQTRRQRQARRLADKHLRQ